MFGGRAPDFGAFLLTGGVLGAVVGVLVGVAGRIDARYDTFVALGFLGLVFGGLGVLVGGVVAVLLDRQR